MGFVKHVDVRFQYSKRTSHRPNEGDIVADDEISCGRSKPKSLGDDIPSNRLVILMCYKLLIYMKPRILNINIIF